MKRILIITEANDKVASGHLMECIEIFNTLSQAEYDVSFMINDDMPIALQSKIGFPYSTYSSDLFYGKGIIIDTLLKNKIDIVIINFRNIEDELLLFIRKHYLGKIICIDELGHRHLSADIIINPMIDTYYHKYDNLDAKLYVGAKYLVLPHTIAEYHKRKKNIKEKITNITVSMGGVDPFGTTLKLAEWLPKILPNVNINLVLGGGFKFEIDLLKIIDDNDKIRIHKNIDYIYDLFYDTDVVFCAGGNTLHELACIGTPTIIIPSMLHEVRNARAFEEYGFGLPLPITNNVSLSDVDSAVKEIQELNLRRNFCEKGKEIVTGNGCYELLKITDDIVCNK